jgi:hypothetical protein
MLQCARYHKYRAINVNIVMTPRPIVDRGSAIFTFAHREQAEAATVIYADIRIEALVIGVPKSRQPATKNVRRGGDSSPTVICADRTGQAAGTRKRSREKEKERERAR